MNYIVCIVPYFAILVRTGTQAATYVFKPILLLHHSVISILVAVVSLNLKNPISHLSFFIAKSSYKISCDEHVCTRQNWTHSHNYT